MDSFDGLLPALFSFLSNNHRAPRGSQQQPHNLSARSPCLDHHLANYNNSGAGGGGGADTQWKLLRQSSINSITEYSARGCLAGLPFWRPPAMPAAATRSASAAGCTTSGLYANLTSKMERKVLLSSARLNCALPITTTTIHHHHHHHHQRAIDAPSNDDFYQALSGYP